MKAVCILLVVAMVFVAVGCADIKVDLKGKKNDDEKKEDSRLPVEREHPALVCANAFVAGHA